MNRTIVLLFLLTNTVPLLAQISGQVLCNDTRKPIPYANVYTAEGIAVAYADENGKFEFADSKLSMPLFFTAVGYEKSIYSRYNYGCYFFRSQDYKSCRGHNLKKEKYQKSPGGYDRRKNSSN